MTTTTMDDILETLMRELAEDRGASIRATAQLTGDDGDGVAERDDIANVNIFSASDTGRATIGGRDSSGNFRADFGSKDAALAFNAEIKSLLADFRSILTKDTEVGRNGVAVDNSRPDTNIVEQILVRAAQAFGGTLRTDADFSGDSFGDAVNFPGGNVLGLVGGDNDGLNDAVIVGGRGTSGNFVLQFDDAATAEAFLAVATQINDWGADFF